MVALISGLGGPRGFGEGVLSRNDDGSTQSIDITPVFENGLNFFGTVYNDLFLNNNGSVTFEFPRSTFTPDVITGTSGNPEITPFFGDVDTRQTGVGPEEPANLNPFSSGNSTGSNLTWYAIDTVGDRLVFTWDDVGYFAQRQDKLNSFQLIITDRGANDFDIEFRYEEINWTTGEASGGVDGLGGTVARAGWTAGTGEEGEFFELPQSGVQNEILALESLPGNTGQPGRWFFSVRNGDVVDAGVPQGPANPLIAESFGDPHLITFDGVPYDFMATGEYILAREIGGPIEVQARQVPIADDFSANSAVATRLGTATVVIDATLTNPLVMNGTSTALADFSSVAVGNGLVGREGDTYTIVYPGDDGVVNEGDERLIARLVGDGTINLRMEVDPNRSREFEGLWGDADSNPDNDIFFANGSQLARPLEFNELYGPYRDDWRVQATDGITTQAADDVSLFNYAPGEGPDTFFDPAFPTEAFTVADLDREDRLAAEQAAIDAGLRPGTFNFNSAVLDFALTGDRAFLEGALDAREIDEDAAVNGQLSPTQAQVVAYLYEAGLDRDGNIDLEGLNFWIDARENGLGVEELAFFFLTSPEFAELVGDVNTLTAEELVTALFENVLDRDPDPAGIQFWVDAVDGGLTNEQLLLAFGESPENIDGSQYILGLEETGEGEWSFV